MFDAKEAARLVYWRSCSMCGDVDRDSVEKALQAAFEAGRVEGREQAAKLCAQWEGGRWLADTIRELGSLAVRKEGA